MSHVWLALPFMLAGWALLLRCGPALDALTLGEETAASLGFSLNRLRLSVIVGTAFAVGAGVAVSGAIGFIGLVVPHLLRPLVGHRPGLLLPASAMGGAALLLAADIGVRLMPTHAEFKLGVLTALLGAPFFLVLILKTRRRPL
jgi:iron complex transport system permease protein